MSIAGRPAHLSVPKNSTGAKRKENSGRGDLTVSLIYLTFPCCLGWAGGDVQHRREQDRQGWGSGHILLRRSWFGTSGTAFPRVFQESLLRWKLPFLKAVEGKAPNLKMKGQSLSVCRRKVLSWRSDLQWFACNLYRFHWNRISEKFCVGGGGVTTWEYFIWVILMRMKCFRFLFLKWHFSYLRRCNGFSVLLLKFKSTLKSWNQSLLFWLQQKISAAFVSRTVMVVVAFHFNKMWKKNINLVWDETCMLEERPDLNHWVSEFLSPLLPEQRLP